MAPPVKIKRSSSPSGTSGGKSKGGKGSAQFVGSKPIHLILATAVVTALLIGIASYLLPELPHKSSSPAVSQPAVPLPPIGQSPPRAMPHAQDSILPPPDFTTAPTQNATPASPAPAAAASAVPPAAKTTPASPPAAKTAPHQTAAPSPPASPSSPDAVQLALQDAARLATQAPASPAKTPAKDKSATQPQTQDPPITAEERAHTNTLVAARVEKAQGRCVLHLTAARPLNRYKWLQLENPPRVALDLIGLWDANGMTRDQGDGLCVRELRLGRHPDRLRVVVEMAGGSSAGPKAPAVEKPTPSELLVTLPHR